MLYLKTAAVTLAMASCVSDLFYGTIPNIFSTMGCVAGFVLHLLVYGEKGAGDCLIGLMIPLCTGAVLFYFRMAGAGDIKEMAAVGSIAGGRNILKICAFSIYLGAGIALILLLTGGGLKERLKYLLDWTVRRMMEHRRIPYRKTEESLKQCTRGYRILSPENFHFTVPVFMAVLFYAGGVFG